MHQSSWDGVVSTVTRLPAARFGVRIAAGSRIFSFPNASTDCVPSQPPVHWVPGTVSPEVKWAGGEADHSLPLGAEIRISGSIPPLSVYAFMIHTAGGHIFEISRSRLKFLGASMYNVVAVATLSPECVRLATRVRRRCTRAYLFLSVPCS
jgi:hypothetical protein